MRKASRSPQILRVRPLPGGRRGVLALGPWRFPCALGRGGIRIAKREGDGGTPRGSLPLRRVWWRADRGPRPATHLALRPIRPRDGWSDDPADRRYNRPVRRPHPFRHEALWRDDGLYDVVVELGWNDRPVRSGHGSAIFLHHARPGLPPTEGCVALHRTHLRRVLAVLGPASRLAIG